MPPTSVIRILDAALNRAGEGLRVVEDYARFALDDPFLTRQIKSLRHDLAAASHTVPPAERHAARDTVHDVGTQIATPAEQHRADTWDVCGASLKRTEQSLRSLEEYGKLADSQFARTMESLRYRLYTLEKAIDLGRLSRDRLEGVQLCVLVDGQATEAAFGALVSALVGAEVGMIQIRDKRLDDRNLIARARLLRQLTGGSSTLAVINDRADVAAAVGADGLHLGQEDLSVRDARVVVGTSTLIGVSTHDIEQAQAAVLDGANYLGAGPTFPSNTKSFDTFAGLGYLRQVAAEVRLPTFAIGGITAANLPEVLATGINRVAVGAAITAADQPASAARRLLGMLKSQTATTGRGFTSL
jgi:thiamine-phosphate pyrophosphorylase